MGGLCTGGGTGGAGGAHCSDPNLIDDMEDNDDIICLGSGRNGMWYTQNDGTAGTQFPEMRDIFAMSAHDPLLPRDGSAYAARTYVQDFNADAFDGVGGWALMGVTILNTENGPYDASASTGIRFEVLGYTATQWIRVYIRSGTCTAGGLCGGFYKDIEVYQDLWTSAEVPFADLVQPAWAEPATFDPATIMGIEFRIEPVSGAEHSIFDVSVDDLRFY